MTPSNPTNSQPLIYRIADALGVFHLVAPVDHTHTYAEVPGLQDELNEVWAGLNEKANQEDTTEALAGKQNVLTFDSTPTANSTNPVTSGGVKTALDAKQNVLTFDSTPTANSTNPVTSGGVKAALESKANKVDVMYNVFEKSDENENIELDNVFSDGHETSHFVLINRMGEQIKVSDFFYTQYGELVENGHTLSNDSTAIVKIIHHNDGSTIRFYMVVEEVFEA